LNCSIASAALFFVNENFALISSPARLWSIPIIRILICISCSFFHIPSYHTTKYMDAEYLFFISENKQ